MTYIHFTPKSANGKIGAIPASTSSDNTCPDSCPFNGDGCYAGTGPVSWHWKKVSKGLRGETLSEFLGHIQALGAGQLWRHNVAGDLYGDNETIDGDALNALVQANTGKRGFTYTHKTTLSENFPLIKRANDNGFTINLSANNLEHADSLAGLNVAPVTVVLPIDAPKKQLTPAGRVVVTCPATYRDDTNCNTCQLCAVSTRETIVGFPAHGVKKASADTIARRVINIVKQ